MDATRPTDLPGIKHQSPAESIRNRLRLLHAPVYGMREQPRTRLLEIEEGARKKKTIYNESWQLSAMLVPRHCQNKNGAQRFFLLQNLCLAKRWTRHKATHFWSKPWYKYCQKEKGRQVRHRNYLRTVIEKAGLSKWSTSSRRPLASKPSCKRRHGQQQ